MEATEFIILRMILHRLFFKVILWALKRLLVCLKVKNNLRQQYIRDGNEA